jgi:ABC-2 type transport system permease protein
MSKQCRAESRITMTGKFRKISAGSNILFLVLIVLGFLALLNFLSTRHFYRLDLTHGGRYTLSDASKRVSATLDDVVTVKCYFSKNLPPYVVNLKRQVTDMLDEYQAFAKGNVQVEFIDPGEDPAVQQKVRFMGIPQVQMNIVEKDQASATNVYLGMAVTYEDKQEIIPFVKSIEGLEYDLTSSILKVTRKEKKTIGFLAGHQEMELQGKGLNNVNALLSKEYEVQPVEVVGGKPISPSISLLVVAGPSRVGERAKYEIDQYLMRGGKVFFLVDPITIPEGSIQATYRDSNLGDLLEHYGVRLTRNLVLDRYNSLIRFQTGYTIVQTPYPFFTKVIKTGFDPENPVVSQLESVTFPWACALEVLKDSHPGLSFTLLAQSSQHSWLQKGMYDLNPTQEFSPEPEDIKPYPLAVLVSGKLKSFYAGKEVPKAEEAQTEPPQEEQSKDQEHAKTETLAECAHETQLMVIGNARFIADNYAPQSGNLEFFLNAVDWFTWGADLIGIRSRAITDRPIPIFTERQKAAIKFANIMAVPILMTLFGVVRFYIRRKRKITLNDLS